ncbi:glycosyl hydrolase family 28-related protein [Jeotgalibacillus sp. R-1-5s-1]|uniref:glycosyl hydrolase family 28-related protein n=1 Tax=Jeotgalibacillus sp. R-1-5s-1 TaxID=2555897 RepID=UPI00106964EA|nr:glycosyl hydrolase family 28-related protein [Jeotgalibacillus sp. R-1-5s-1]TFE00018.1 hypothetical protein E2491_06130 [Jeotgalibacillus sp. R-1-5s-1]
MKKIILALILLAVVTSTVFYWSDDEKTQGTVDVVSGEESVTAISVRTYGAVGDGENDDTDAIKMALSENDHIYFPTGTYLITDSIEIDSKRVEGSGMDTAIIYSTANAPIFRMTGSKNDVRNLGLSYEGWDQREYTERNAIQFEDQIANSVFESIHMVSVYRGFYIAQNKENYAFSVNMRNIYVYQYAKNAIHLVPPQGGNTGSVIENIYTSNGLRENRYEPDVVPFVFERASEMTLIQLNAEWANISSAFQFDYCFNVVVISPHLEGNNLKKENSTFFNVNDSNVKIIGGRAYDNLIESNSSVFTMQWNSMVSVDTFYTEANQETDGSLSLLRTEDSTGGRIELTGFKTDKEELLKNQYLLNEDQTPVLTRLNDRSYFDGIGIYSAEELPEPSESWRGKMILIEINGTDLIYICVVENNRYLWKEISQDENNEERGMDI